MSSSPPEIRPARLGTSTGSNVPARSRGTASGTGPTPVCTVLAIVPFREFPELCPARSCGSYPRCAAISASSARSSTARTSSPSIDPSPVSRSCPSSSFDRASSRSSARSPTSSRTVSPRSAPGPSGISPPPSASPLKRAFRLIPGMITDLPPKSGASPARHMITLSHSLHTWRDTPVWVCGRGRAGGPGQVAQRGCGCGGGDEGGGQGA
jgi:hypothetical protein